MTEYEGPEVVNVERGEPLLRLVHIDDPQPFIETLVACGVPGDELKDWRILSQKPEEKLPDQKNAVILSATEISGKMTARATFNTYGHEDFTHTYVNAFESIAPKIILQQIARAVALKNLEQHNKFTQRHRISIGAGLMMGGYLGTFLAVDVGAGLEIIPSVCVGLASGGILSGVGRLALSEDRKANKFAKRVSEANPQLPARLAKAITPIFYVR
jgi:hypothetical protein